MKTLKEKFGKFEMTKEQMKSVNGGAIAYFDCTVLGFSGRTRAQALASSLDCYLAMQAGASGCKCK